MFITLYIREIQHCVYGKRQAEISCLPITREIYLVSAYILPVSHSYGVSTKNSEISYNKIIFLLYDKQQPAVCRLALAVNAKLNLSNICHSTSDFRAVWCSRYLRASLPLNNGMLQRIAHNTRNSMPYALRIVCGLFYIPQNYEH